MPYSVRCKSQEKTLFTHKICTENLYQTKYLSYFFLRHYKFYSIFQTLFQFVSSLSCCLKKKIVRMIKGKQRRGKQEKSAYIKFFLPKHYKQLKIITWSPYLKLTGSRYRAKRKVSTVCL